MYQVLRRRAIVLRKKGYSYNLIRHRIPVSKSTLSYWLREIPYKPNKLVRERVNKRLLEFVMEKRRKKMASIRLIQSEMEQKLLPLSLRDLEMFGLGIYVGEGTKLLSLLRIVNADPRVICLAIRWLQDVFLVPQKNFYLRIHLYPDSNIEEALRYWSKVTGIPKTQFYSPQIDLRANKSGKKHNKLPYGTAHLSVKSFGNTAFGIDLHRRIMSAIDIAFKNFAIIRWK